METTNNLFEDLGSVNDFANANRLDPSSAETLSQYSQLLVERRKQVARQLGIAVEDLRLNSPSTVVDIAEC